MRLRRRSSVFRSRFEIAIFVTHNRLPISSIGLLDLEILLTLLRCTDIILTREEV